MLWPGKVQAVGKALHLGGVNWIAWNVNHFAMVYGRTKVFLAGVIQQEECCVA